MKFTVRKHDEGCYKIPKYLFNALVVGFGVYLYFNIRPCTLLLLNRPKHKMERNNIN